MEYHPPNELSVQGVYCSNVVDVSPPCTVEGGLPEIWKAFREWLAGTSVADQLHADGILEDELLKILIFHHYRERYPQSQEHDLPYFEQWKRYILQSDDANSEKVQSETDPDPTETRCRIAQLGGRCLFTLGSGNLGLGPPGVQKGKF